MFYRFKKAKWLPTDYTPNWLLFYGKLVMTSLIISNLMPYLGPMLKILCRRGCCCCKRKNYKQNKNQNEEFPLERRYASILSTIFVCFTFGFSIPLLFVIAAIILLIQFFIDKLLITYYYRERVEQNDLMNRSVLGVIKYGAVLFLVSGGFAVAFNYCSIEN